MDKYEYGIKADKLKKLAEKKDYVTAAKLADTIDWHRVKNMRMLSLVALIYEKVERYSDAKEILLQAYEQAPTGRRLLYKLTEISVKEREFDDAELFYREFSEVAPDDLGRYILRFTILSNKGESLDKQISILEAYKKREFDEKWAFELAKLYHKAGRSEDCVRLCDEIILWFSCGRYVDRAMELKTIYQPLTAEQQEKAENKEQYEEKLRELEKASEDAVPKSVIMKGNKPEPVEETKEADEEEPVSEEPDMELPVIQIPEIEFEEEPEIEIPDTEEPETENPVEENPAEENPVEELLVEENPEAEEVVEETVSETAEEPVEMPTAEEPKDVQSEIAELEAALQAAIDAVTREAAATRQPEPVEEPEEEAVDEPEEPKTQIIRAFSLRKEPGAVELAVEKLKEVHELLGTPPQKVAKISGEKLNKVGLLASLDRLANADLIVTDAENLNDHIKQEIEAVVTADTNTMVIILIEEEKEEEELPVIQIPEVTLEEIAEPEPVPEPAPAPKKAPKKSPAKDLNLDDFVSFVKDYADQLECILDDMAELAVYAAAEDLLEDGIALNEDSARDLTEEAVERAEKRSLRALFGSRYDREAGLILKEVHFRS